MRKPPQYCQNEVHTCPECEKDCRAVPDRSDFDHEHGTEYPAGWGKPVSNCCEAPLEAEPIH